MFKGSWCSRPPERQQRIQKAGWCSRRARKRQQRGRAACPGPRANTCWNPMGARLAESSIHDACIMLSAPYNWCMCHPPRRLVLCCTRPRAAGTLSCCCAPSGPAQARNILRMAALLSLGHCSRWAAAVAGRLRSLAARSRAPSCCTPRSCQAELQVAAAQVLPVLLPHAAGRGGGGAAQVRPAPCAGSQASAWRVQCRGRRPAP